jgi:hypothetical protein
MACHLDVFNGSGQHLGQHLTEFGAGMKRAQVDIPEPLFSLLVPREARLLRHGPH